MRENKKIWILVFVIFVFAFVLRIWFLKDLSLTFGYDQARDAYVSQEIIAGDLKILGPPASTPGLYHGVFYYYLLAPAYMLGHGSPVVAAIWIALLNASAVFIVYYLTYLLTRKVKAGLLAALFFAVSFEATQYATWLSNPTIGVWTVPLIYLGLWAWIAGKKKWGPIIAALGLGLSIQTDVFLVYHAIPLAIWLIVAKKNINKKQLVSFLAMLFVSLLSMIAVEIKFGFKGISGFATLLTTNDAIVATKGLGDFIVLFFNQLGRTFAYSSYPGNIGYGGILVLVLLLISLYKWRKGTVSWEPFLATWLFSHITVATVGGTSTPFLMVGIGPAVSILLGIWAADFWQKKKKVLAYLFIVFIVFGNLMMIVKQNPKGSVIFAIQKDMLLKKQLAAIDYTYQQAGGEDFSTNSLTSPLWINIVWTYLYNWYGLPKYGYTPQWHGRDQVGQLATLTTAAADTKKYFLILEPMGGIPVRYLDETIQIEDSYSELVGEKYFGELIIQERERIK
ncbi:ArnT family glycosyltransferase [Patescibacteria group bacterium]